MHNSFWTSYVFLLNQNWIIIEICACELDHIYLYKWNILIIRNTELFYIFQ